MTRAVPKLRLENLDGITSFFGNIRLLNKFVEIAWRRTPDRSVKYRAGRGGHEQDRDHQQSVGIPPNAAAAIEIYPEAEFIKRQPETQPVEKRNPGSRTRAFEQ